MATTINPKMVAYYRVSTKAQGQSGLGLEGQQTAVEGYARAVGGEILKSFTEIESGKRADRPELAKAIAYARRSGATLVIAKLDRLARNVHFLSGLMESKVDFVACDNATANRLTIHILAAVAEDEAIRISERTKAALAAYKARGGLLGAALVGSRLTDADRAKGSAKGNAKLVSQARNSVADLLPEILRLKASGSTQRAIADALNTEGHKTAKGAEWTSAQVCRVLQREGITSVKTPETATA
ncbi:MAG: Site-specific recombinase [Planctomycetota bacterium]|nr:Site-specific recombinase [Planctomycetota bacterium]